MLQMLRDYNHFREPPKLSIRREDNHALARVLRLKVVMVRPAWHVA